MKKNISIKSISIKCFVGLLATSWLIITIVPFIFMLLAGFKEQFELLMGSVFDLPKSLYLNNYIEVFKGNILVYFKNSVIVLVVSLVILLVLSACASYPLSRFKFKFRKPIYSVIVALMSVPIHVTLLPIFIMTTKIGLYDSIWALVGPYVAFNLPISIFILVTFMNEIPKELEEAAEIDGCSKYKIFIYIIFPLIKPGLATLAIYNGVSIWNEFSFALTLTQSLQNRTLPLSIWEYQGQYTMNVPMIMSVLTISMLPMIIAFVFGKDKLIKGMMAGAVKG
ncbi:carbohydrate ABC transporter permease [Clostridium sp. AL.422]|uniref:carbohydrate ABC transporter permease n=1 Tax=Clostridium TaxID=1485 RepID=UPI00293DAC0F|nr:MULTISPECIES: carbohydrate ABC transporter permease [unclassified Clostridium]MDV4151035.1 carbohydrate ABC transporter permease [Clostridium sp. AL.422]